MSESLPLRIVLLAPPAGVPSALQEGKAAAATLVPPLSVTRERVILATKVAVAGEDATGRPILRGRAIQGPPGGRFLYAASGQRAGDHASPCDRRAKIALATITAPLLATWRQHAARSADVWLEAHVAGTARDGGPACATVPVLDGGWRLGGAPQPSDAA